MVDSLQHAQGSPLFTDQEKAAIALSIELTKRAELSNEAFDHAARHFDERQLVELVVNLGIANLNNRFTDAFWADVDERE
ncbi:MAG: carboxymuconolactone decarboxylase family protein [Candidatus Limnocylindria bacterium]